MPLQDTIESSQTFLRTLAAQAATFLPNLLVAILVMVIGFFIAGRLAALVAGPSACRASTRPCAGRWWPWCAMS